MSTPALIIRRNDRYPYYSVLVQDAAGNAVDLTDATIYATMAAEGNTTLKINRQTAGIVIDPDQVTNKGEFYYAWQTGDTDTASAIKDSDTAKVKDKYVPFHIEFEINPLSGGKYTLPSNPLDPWPVIIPEDLDAT